ncbi:ferredoxin [Catellatospora sp. NPDC049609]|uniref:ferredoxin n=1 Tax=Catellatospora sp. NPDC049609 TaxID=3155505 RepID=UPI00341BCECD
MESVHVIAATVGFTSFGLLWLAVLGGVALRNGWGLTRLRQPVAYALHQGIALIGLTLGLVHGLAQLAVPGGTITLVEVLIPFVDTHDPVGTGAGVLGLELVLAAAISIVVQRRLGFSRWRAVHTATYAGFWLISAHVLVSGSDVGPTWVWGTVYAAWLVTVALWFTTRSRARRADGPSITAAGPAHIQGNLRVDVDPVRCARFGFCEQEAPEVFTLQGDGRLDYTAAPPVTRLDDVIRAVEVCPARAITVRHQAAGSPLWTPTQGMPHVVRPRGRNTFEPTSGRTGFEPAGGRSGFEPTSGRSGFEPAGGRGGFEPASRNTFEPATELDEYRQARGRHSRAQHHAAVHRDELTDEEKQ